MFEEHNRQMDIKQKENDQMQKETERLSRQVEFVTCALPSIDDLTSRFADTI
jgi:hypothetical protein